MALPAPIQALYDKLYSFYNGNAYDPSTNPGGFARGGNQMGVFIAMLRDFASFGKAIAEIGQTVSDKAAQFQAAVDAIVAGPVTSVNGRSGVVQGLAEWVGGTFTGVVNGVTRAFGDNGKAFATTEFVQAAYPKATAAQRRALTSDVVVNTPASDAAAMAFGTQTISSATSATLNFANGFNVAFTMGGNLTITGLSNAFDGLPVVVCFIQDGTGGRSVSFASASNKFPGGTVPTLSTAANAVDRLSGICRNRSGTMVVEWSGIEKDIK